MSTSLSASIETLAEALQSDPELAWVWHCQIAMSNMEGGYLKWKESNEAACRTMMNLFKVDTSPKFKELLKTRVPPEKINV